MRGSFSANWYLKGNRCLAVILLGERETNEKNSLRATKEDKREAKKTNKKSIFEEK